jgi:hypothetical protein
MTKEERDLANQQLQELSAELELLAFDRKNGRITDDQFDIDLVCIKVRMRSLGEWIIQDHDEFQREAAKVGHGPHGRFFT